MSFQAPVYFLLFIPLFVLVVYKIMFIRKSRPTLQYSDVKDIKKVPRGIRVYLRNLPAAMMVVAMSLFIVALARPQKSDTKVKRDVEGIDIMFVLDISDSMLIEDMQPVNRMESSKKTIENFIQNRISDRMGLVVFSGESYTKVPLTLDHELLIKQLSDVQPERAVKMGTAIGVGLANGIARLKDSTAKSRVLILLTDGENNSGTIDPLTALEIAKGYQVRIYTIGAGVDGEAQLPIYQTDAFGNTYKRYQPIHSKVNDELLSQLASETNGKYYRATNTKALENVFSDINKLEKTKIEVNKYTKYTELYQQVLFIGFIFYMLGLFFRNTILRGAP